MNSWGIDLYLECGCQLEEVANDEVDPILDTIDSGIVARILDLLRVDVYGYHMEVPARNTKMYVKQNYQTLALVTKHKHHDQTLALTFGLDPDPDQMR